MSTVASDEFGFDAGLFRKVEPLVRILNERYFRIQVTGLENIPDEGRVILVGNHSGVIPIDGLLFSCAYHNRHPAPRRIRFLTHDWLLALPGLAPVFKAIGCVPARYDAARKLLNRQEIVFFYPEGARGTSKPFAMRYRLCDFDPGFVKAALETDCTVVPVSTVGADEIYPLVANCKPIADIMDAPYWPLGLTFPWLPFPFSIIPLPIQIRIKVGKPIKFNSEKRDRRTRVRLARQVQYGIQNELNELLRTRDNAFTGWSP